MNNIFKRQSIKSNFIIFQNWGLFFIMLENLQQLGFIGGNFVIFRATLWEILKFEYNLSLSNNLKQFVHNWVLSSKSCSHLGKLHGLH